MEKCYAKVNLSLYVTGTDERGYHTLDSLVSAIDLYDELEMTAWDCASAVAFESGEMDASSIPMRNTCAVAIERMSALVGVSGARARVIKNIPLGGGLGGSSADAAGVMRAFCTRFGLDVLDARVTEIALSVGADVPCMLKTGYHRVTGTGEAVARVEGIAPCHLVLAAADAVGVSARESYAAFDRIGSNSVNANGELIDQLRRLGWSGADRTLFYNALTDASVSLSAGIEKTLDALKCVRPMSVAMSGSGNVCYAAFVTKEDALAAAASVTLPYVRVVQTL